MGPIPKQSEDILKKKKAIFIKDSWKVNLITFARMTNNLGSGFQTKEYILKSLYPHPTEYLRGSSLWPVKSFSSVFGNTGQNDPT